MTFEPIVVLASLWLAAGMTFASILYRRGHDGWHWMLVCAVTGPVSALLVADQARFVEPDAEPSTVGGRPGTSSGVTVVVPASAVGAVDASTLGCLSMPIRQVAVVAPVAFEHIGSTTPSELQRSMRPVVEEAVQRFAPHEVELVQAPGRTADAIVAVAADRAPALILTTRGAHEPHTVGRLARLAASRPAIATVITDPAAIPAATAERTGR
ncbi:MAG TPA: hypothetical protein VFK43_08735 [Acidimicrobiales bacterium]|nr:hypothetical protein [Acidimicrobiales bacterium]